MVLTLQPITSKYLINRMPQGWINIGIDLIRQVRRPMSQQPLYHGSRGAVLDKDKTEGLAWIMEFEITQPELFAYLGPSVLVERTAEQFLLFRA